MGTRTDNGSTIVYTITDRLTGIEHVATGADELKATLLALAEGNRGEEEGGGDAEDFWAPAEDLSDELSHAVYSIVGAARESTEHGWDKLTDELDMLNIVITREGERTGNLTLRELEANLAEEAWGITPESTCDAFADAALRALDGSPYRVDSSWPALANAVFATAWATDIAVGAGLARPEGWYGSEARRDMIDSLTARYGREKDHVCAEVQYMTTEGMVHSDLCFSSPVSKDNRELLHAVLDELLDKARFDDDDYFIVGTPLPEEE